jgi:hypothetical protein
MKITFEDKSYIEIVKSTIPNKVIITIAARDSNNHLATVANSVEITIEQLAELVKI